MKTAPIVAARIEPSAEGLPYSPTFADVYHPRAGAMEQARHVFLAGNGLPGRWAGRDDFVIAETGFGLGNNFLATWAAWRADPQRCARLDFLSVELHPPTRDELAAWPREIALAPLAAELAAQWPALTHNLHRLSFDEGRVRLHLAFGDVARWVPEWVAGVEAFFLDGFAPARNPQMWDRRLFKAIARLAVPGATATTWSAARSVREGLQAAGFTVSKAPGQGGKRDITVARFEPAPSRRGAPPGRPHARSTDSRAIVVGGGLAGCASAWALAEQGWRTTVIDRRDEPALEGSGNPAGLFHGVVMRHDGTHARWLRAAALAFEPIAREAVSGGVAGAVDGLLRLEPQAASVQAMQDVIEQLGLPAQYVQALAAVQASQRAGLALTHPAWFYPGGGWISPRDLAAWYLRRAGPLSAWRGRVEVAQVRRVGDEWQVLDAQGEVIDSAPALVLASAGDTLRLLGAPAWPIDPVRGQISIAPFGRIILPKLPLAGAGYVLPALAGAAIFGATAQPGDLDAAVRMEDHRLNLERLAQLTGCPDELDAASLSGRVGWRWTAGDRLPVIGAVPDADLPAVGSADQPRFIARQPGLFVFTALGSRGIGVSALGARLLAAWVSGAPSPVEASLMDAVDPARFAARDQRRAGRTLNPLRGSAVPG
ncbi:FAD-dependent 5-carboxymethylaminomethyl-2-thiouridine(34) oxidoreductase MnmC [Rhizobacter sp. AJA081-3]|uniref:FAD-dependent 5-carboxymethylaminomethyl-2-thiouridine(34) oxidoreductase MnmC n=1 Tax=Rhizobacter sp. AJA081-3 TaxID=2753607 RepID=UPI001AE09822|nr:FAD-dependent 5-carboxymethylaminomethyl-2-thiouridine(34) oxidoreductase MnmC [Rhizobacter sp. AJA081-3]QTN25199.1 FAD-dependent 5-carboxymethylaminomethyl-2-thiouridine(34) oxidoreductase MnmC [Rhizobacter sp. AJA081-3]